MSGVNLFYEESGEGENLILVHGYPLNHKIWVPILPFLGKGIRAILPDLRGCGQSEVGNAPYSMQLMAEDLVRLMDRLKIAKAVIAGHSMGGYVTLKLAHSYPDRIKGIGLVASQAVADTPEKREGRNASINLLKKDGINPIIEGMLPRLTDSAELKPVVRKIMAESNPSGLVGCLMAMAGREDASDWLPLINVPALVLAGRNDKIIPVEYAQDMDRRFTHSELVILEQSGHMPMIEQPQEAASAFQSLVRRIQKEPGR